MFARLNIFKGSPETIDEATQGAREEALPAARELEGFAGMLILWDRSTGKTVGITFWDSQDALEASEEAADRIRGQRADATGDEIVGVERYEVTLDARK